MANFGTCGGAEDPHHVTASSRPIAAIVGEAVGFSVKPDLFAGEAHGRGEGAVMGARKRQKLAIDRGDFVPAFERDVDYDSVTSQFTYLDRQTGEVIWVYERDDDAEMEVGIPAAENREVRLRIEAAPERHLEIPGLDHGEHHDILRAFLKSDWTDDEAAWDNAWNAYSGSIGRWKRTVRGERAIDAFHDFQERKTAEMAEDFLRAHGIDPDWT